MKSRESWVETFNNRALYICSQPIQYFIIKAKYPVYNEELGGSNENRELESCLMCQNRECCHCLIINGCIFNLFRNLIYDML